VGSGVISSAAAKPVQRSARTSGPNASLMSGRG
jgi:hypothetical protein